MAEHSHWNEMAVKVGVETHGVIVSKFQGHVTLTLHSCREIFRLDRVVSITFSLKKCHARRELQFLRML